MILNLTQMVFLSRIESGMGGIKSINNLFVMQEDSGSGPGMTDSFMFYRNMESIQSTNRIQIPNTFNHTRQ